MALRTMALGWVKSTYACNRSIASLLTAPRVFSLIFMCAYAAITFIMRL